jgi:hypothetical protein
MRKRRASLAKLYGMQKPYDLTVAVPFLANILVLALTLIVLASTALGGHVRVGSERFYFFIYVIALLTIATVACTKMPRFSLAASLWCAIELSLGLSSGVLEKHVIGIPLMPQNSSKHRLLEDFRFAYHPLLQAVPKPNQKFKDQFYRGKHAGIDAVANWDYLDGRELLFVHNSLGLRGREPTASDLNKSLIFVYGGSTTYDDTVTQGNTWPEQLQSELKGKYTVMNFGVRMYTTTEHLIQTVFYQTVGGRRPVCAIYYEGINDLINARVENVDRAYADSYLVQKFSQLLVRQPEIWAAKYSPIFRLINQVLKNRFDSIPESRFAEMKFPGSNSHLEGIYAEHIEAIAAINGSRDVRTIFIGQMLDTEAYNRGKTLHSKVDIWPHQARLNQVLRKTAVSAGAKYIDPGIENFRPDDFSDSVHFTVSGSKKFAALIAQDVYNYCEPTVH